MDIIPSVNSDHLAIVLHFDSIEKQKFGPSYWKFNASLLNYLEFMLMINQKLPDWREEFSDVSDKRVLWDLVKYRIRQVTIKYSKEKAHVRRDKLANAESLLKQYEEICGTNLSCENKEKLEIAKNEYDLLYEHLSMGGIIRSRARWYEFGEKSNKYFLSLETSRKSKSAVRKVFSKDSFLTTDLRKIMAEVESYYTNLYKSEPLDPLANLLHSFLGNPGISKLSDEEATLCEGK